MLNALLNIYPLTSLPTYLILSGHAHAGPQLRLERECVRQFMYLLANAAECLRVFMVVEGLSNPPAHLLHFFFSHAASGKRRSANADPTGLKRRIGIKRNGVLVDGDSCLSKG